MEEQKSGNEKKKKGKAGLKNGGDWRAVETEELSNGGRRRRRWGRWRKRRRQVRQQQV